ncbi:MAG: hypothetical protein U0794_02790 [Isosphaeraceae bacterium]
MAHASESPDDGLETPQADEPTTNGRGPSSPESERASRYDANVRLIRARLADEKRMNPVRRWWQSRS